MERPLGHRVTHPGRSLAWLATILVLVATLYPTRSTVGGAFFECLVCGERGLADAVLNVALFLPFGAAMALGTRSWRRALLYAVLLSVGVELQQQGIPGRHSSVGDLAFNTLGAALGVLFVKTSRHWLAPEPRTAARLSLASAIMMAAIIAITGWLLEPALPGSSVYHAQWTPDLAHLERYRGRILSASLGGEPLLPGPLAHSRDVQQRLEQGEEIVVRALGAEHSRGLASLFSIYDDDRKEVVLIGPDRGDLVLRVHSRASRWRLDQPDMRAAGAVRSIIAGDSLDVHVQLGQASHCIGIDGHSSCSYGYTAGRGWAILLYLESFPPWFRGVLDATWMAMLCFPIGLWARHRRETLAALAVAAVGIASIPALGPLLSAPILEIGGAAAGIAAGVAVARVVRRRTAATAAPAPPLASASLATAVSSEGSTG